MLMWLQPLRGCRDPRGQDQQGQVHEAEVWKTERLVPNGSLVQKLKGLYETLAIK